MLLYDAMIGFAVGTFDKRRMATLLESLATMAPKENEAGQD